MPQIPVSGSDSSSGRALRRIVAYHAECDKCFDSPKSPRQAHIHVKATGHRVSETKYYVVEKE